MSDTAVAKFTSGPAPAAAPEPSQQQQQQAQSGDRPAWLPDKFKSPEDLAQAYKALEQKLGQGSQQQASGDDKPADQQDQAQQQQQQAAEALKVAGLDIAPFSEEFAAEGKLSDDSYAKLEQAGFPREIVDTFIAGQMAMQQRAVDLVEKDVAEIKQVAGGDEGYQALSQWATQNLTPEEMESFDTLLQTGSKEVIKLAVAGMVARMQSAEGKEPNLVNPGGRAAQADVFRSMAEAQQAIRDPRYKSDPAYRKDVEAKLIRSNIY
jgi:small-conductance mechanosensitive channel